MKKKCTLTALSFLLCQIYSWGQFDHLWTTVYGGNSTDYGNSITLDANNNAYTTGRFYNTVDFDPGTGNVSLTSAGNADVFITKQDPNGNLIWAKKVGGTNNDISYSVDVDGAGNVFVVGNFSSTADFDPGTGNAPLTALGTSDAFVLKLDTDGNFLWVRPFTGDNSQFALSLSVDPNSNVIVSGYFILNIDLDPGTGVDSRSAVGGNDLFVVKLNSAGSYVWGGTAGGSGSEIAYAVRVDGNSTVYIAGQFMNTVDFDFGTSTTTATSAGVEDAFLLKMNSDGVFQWVKNFGGTGLDVGRGIDVDLSGNVYTIGYFNGTADFDPNAGLNSMTSAGTEDVFIAKLTSNGSFLWSKSIGATGSDYALGIECDANENTFLTGRYFATVDFDPNAGTASQTSNGDADAYVLWLDPNGQFLDVEVFGGAGAELGFSISLNSANELYLTGAYEQTVNFDPSGSGVSFSSNGTSDCFVTKYITCPIPVVPTINGGSTAVCSNTIEAYSVASVPGATSYTWSLPGTWAGSSTSNLITTTTGTNGGTISVTSNNVCGSSTAATINVNVEITPSVLGNNTSICAGDIAQLEGSTDYGNLNWYTEVYGGIAVGSGAQFITGTLVNDTTFYLEADNNGCKNNPRIVIQVTVNPMPNVGINLGGGAIASLQDNATSYQWLDCNNSNAEVLNETSQLFMLSQNGNYAVEINLNGCIDTSDCIMIDNVGVDKMSNGHLKLFPNPSTDKFTAESENGIDEVAVFNMAGELLLREVFTGVVSAELTPQLNPGVYLVKVTDAASNLHITQWIKL